MKKMTERTDFFPLFPPEILLNVDVSTGVSILDFFVFSVRLFVRLPDGTTLSFRHDLRTPALFLTKIRTTCRDACLLGVFERFSCEKQDLEAGTRLLWPNFHVF